MELGNDVNVVVSCTGKITVVPALIKELDVDGVATETVVLIFT